MKIWRRDRRRHQLLACYSGVGGDLYDATRGDGDDGVGARDVDESRRRPRLEAERAAAGHGLAEARRSGAATPRDGWAGAQDGGLGGARETEVAAVVRAGGKGGQ